MTHQPLYPLIPSAWGAAVEIPVSNTIQATLFGDLAGRFGTTYVEVCLEPNPLTGAWLVRREGAIVGEIKAHHRKRFADIEDVHRAGFVPTTLAGLTLNPEDGRFEATVFLPPAQLALPRNNAFDPHVVLPEGEMMVVETQTGEFSAAELQSLSPGQWLVGLQVIGASAVATLNGRVLGSFSESDNLELCSFIHAARGSHDSILVCARAHALEAMVGLDVCSPASPHAQCRHLPAISRPSAHHSTPWRVTEFSDGTWAVTVERDAAVDAAVDAADDTAAANPAVRSSAARRISSPDARASSGVNPGENPSIDFTPTTSFRAAAHAYLTEVEKVRLRREKRAQGAEGRHRRRKWK